jgi:membrane protease subunit HflK
VVSKSEGEAYRFNQILTEYTKAPDVTRERLYRETLEDVFSSTNKVIVDSSSNSMMYLPIDKLINSSRTPKSSSTGNSFQQTPSGNSNDQGVLRSRENR